MIHYISDPSDEKYIPWLDGAGNSIQITCNVMENLCAEIRRVATTPGARPKSPMPQLRDKARSIIEDNRDFDGDVPREIAAHVLCCMDRETIEALNWNAPSTQVSTEQWDLISAHLTPDILNRMLDQNLAIYSVPLPHTSPDLSPETAAALTKKMAEHIHTVRHLPDFVDAVAEGKLTPHLAAAFVRTAVERHPDQAWSASLSHAASTGSATTFIACVVAGLAREPTDLSRFDDARCHYLISLAASNHGKIRLKGGIPDLVAFLSDPEPVLDRIAA